MSNNKYIFTCFTDHAPQNLAMLDGWKCSRCGEEIEVVEVQDEKGRIFIDRSNRVDVDGSCGEEKAQLRSYHLSCWRKEIGI